MAVELRKWFNNQHRWKTQKELADDIGIPYSTLKKIFQGTREPKGQYKQKLYEITKLPCFHDLNAKDLPPSSSDVDALEKAFYSLAEALEPFKYGTPQQREEVRNRIPVEDVGYVISFLKAIYDEDRFSDFIFFTEYRKKGGDKDD